MHVLTLRHWLVPHSNTEGRSREEFASSNGFYCAFPSRSNPYVMSCTFHASRPLQWDCQQVQDSRLVPCSASGEADFHLERSDLWPASLQEKPHGEVDVLQHPKQWFRCCPPPPSPIPFNFGSLGVKVPGKLEISEIWLSRRTSYLFETFRES